MAGIRLEVSFDDGGLGAALQRAIAVAADPKEVLKASGELLVASTVERFDSGHGPDGIPWPPSGRVRAAAVPNKRARKQPYGPLQGGKTLIKSGALRASITSEVRGNEVLVGSAANAEGDVSRYAAVHQFGAHITPTKGEFLVFPGADGHLVFARSVDVPARPFVGIDEKDTEDLDALWTATMRDAFEGNGHE